MSAAKSTLTDAEREAVGDYLRRRGTYSHAVLCDAIDALDLVLSARVAAARADERDLRRVLSAYAPGWDGTLPHLVQILSAWPVAKYEAERIRAALAQPADTKAADR